MFTVRFGHKQNFVWFPINLKIINNKYIRCQINYNEHKSISLYVKHCNDLIKYLFYDSIIYHDWSFYVQWEVRIAIHACSCLIFFFQINISHSYAYIFRTKKYCHDHSLQNLWIQFIFHVCSLAKLCTN